MLPIFKKSFSLELFPREFILILAKYAGEMRGKIGLHDAKRGGRGELDFILMI